MKKILPIVIILIVVGAGTFFAGMKYGQSKTPQRQGFQQTGAAGVGFRNNRDSAGFTSGEIVAKDDQSVTIKLQNGGSKIIFYSDSTEISKFTSGTSSDLEVGKTIMVNGKTNDDGSITAQTIQLRPAMPTQP